MLLSLLTFSLAATLIVLLPGPDTLVVLRNLVRGGRISAIRTVLGVLTGLLCWVVTAVLGLSAVLRASEDAYLALRIAGAAYLVWLGISSLRSRGQVAPDHAGPDQPARRSLVGRGFPAGLVTNLLNPKVGVFFVTFLPGFVPSGYPVGRVSLLLGGIYVLLTALYFAVLIGAANQVRGWLATRHIRRRLDRATGLVLVGFGLKLAVEG
ncbi:MAG TPA: LysE family translocator [Jatrophihabitans sp.]|nr:LysE family translocator [Jatrophihabitans sp.]